MDSIAECEQLSYAAGIAAGLELALTGVDIDMPPMQIAALPASRISSATAVVDHSLAAEVGICFARCTANRRQLATGFGARLGAVRLGVTRRLLDWAMQHLSSRVAGGEPIIRKQLVLGVLADSHTSLQALRHCLSAAADMPAAMTEVHDRITVLDWDITKLLGASGYVGEGPAREAYVSLLIANCWIPRRALMTELDPQLRQLRGFAAEAGRDLRSRALAVDAHPEDMAPHLDSPTLALIRNASTPKQYRGARGMAVLEYADSCLARAVASVELAHGDAGLLAANTGPALAGVAVDALGSETQQDVFYERISDGRTWTFFGMTEQAHGSDATAMETSLDPDELGNYRLNGGKRYVGNADRGAIGVIFGRTGPTPLAIRAAMIECPAPGFAATALDMTGLRGARISELSFTDVPVSRAMILGSHLPASRRGMWGASRTFNVMRTQIAAMAIGVAFAALDYVRDERPGWSGCEPVGARLLGARALLYEAAAAVDLSPDDRRPASIAKLHATALAIKVTRWAAAALGAGSLLEHPLLEKWCRDVYAFEFMDGTSNILRLHITQGIGARPAMGVAR